MKKFLIILALSLFVTGVQAKDKKKDKKSKDNIEASSDSLPKQLSDSQKSAMALEAAKAQMKAEAAARKKAAAEEEAKARAEAKAEKKAKSQKKVSAKEREEIQDAKIMGQALAILIHRHDVKGDTIAKELSAEFRKSAMAQTEIARAYVSNRRNETAVKYLDKALKINPKYSSAYILRGDIFVPEEESETKWVITDDIKDSAAVFYRKAIAADSMKTAAYEKYATVLARAHHLDSAQVILESLHKINPDYDSNTTYAILSSKYDPNGKHEGWLQTDPNKLTFNQLAKSAQDLYWSHNYAASLERGLVGIRRFPGQRGRQFYRIVLWDAAQVGEFKTALENGNKYLASIPADSLNDQKFIKSIDWYSIGASEIALGNIDKGFQYFGRIANTNDDFTSVMDGKITALMNTQVKEKEKAKDYAGAKAMYKKYMAAYPSKSNKDGQFFDYVDIYSTEVADLNEQKNVEERDAVLKQLFALYKEFEEKYPDSRYINYIYYYEAMYTSAFVDPNNDQQLAKPYYMKLYESVTKKKDMSSSETRMAIGAARYMAQMAYFKDHDEAQAYVWFNKVLDLDPTDEMALKALTIIKPPKAAGGAKGKKKK